MNRGKVTTGLINLQVSYQKKIRKIIQGVINDIPIAQIEGIPDVTAKMTDTVQHLGR